MGSWPLLVIVLRDIKYTVHTSTLLRATRRHDLSRLWWPAWLRGPRGRLCRLTWAGRRGWLGSRSQHEATAEEIEACPAKHLALQHFEAIDMALHRAIGPRERHAGFDGRIVVPEPGGKAAE